MKSQDNMRGPREEILKVPRFYSNPRVFLKSSGQKSGTITPIPPSSDQIWIV
jgi:hypothetical protein